VKNIKVDAFGGYTYPPLVSTTLEGGYTILHLHI